MKVDDLIRNCLPQVTFGKSEADNKRVADERRRADDKIADGML